MVLVPGNKERSMVLVRVTNGAGKVSKDHTMKGFVSYVKDFEIYYDNKLPFECFTTCQTLY